MLSCFVGLICPTGRSETLRPSSDFAPSKRNQSLRENSDKAVSGQERHEGFTHPMKEVPDKVIKHSLCICNECGKDLTDVIAESLVDKRQVIDMPRVKPIYTKHHVYKKTCSCGHVTEGSFPQGVNAQTKYGNSVEAARTYMHNRQYMPYERIAEYFKHLMNLPVSPGTLNNIVHRFAQKESPAYNAIKASIEQSEYAGSDETGGKVNGKKHWFWTWQNDKCTFIIHSESRGFDTIEFTFPDGLPNTI